MKQHKLASVLHQDSQSRTERRYLEGRQTGWAWGSLEAQPQGIYPPVEMLKGSGPPRPCPNLLFRLYPPAPDNFSHLRLPLPPHADDSKHLPSAQGPCCIPVLPRQQPMCCLLSYRHIQLACLNQSITYPLVHPPPGLLAQWPAPLSAQERNPGSTLMPLSFSPSISKDCHTWSICSLNTGRDS